MLIWLVRDYREKNLRLARFYCFVQEVVVPELEVSRELRREVAFIMVNDDKLEKEEILIRLCPERYWVEFQGEVQKIYNGGDKTSLKKLSKGFFLDTQPTTNLDGEVVRHQNHLDSNPSNPADEDLSQLTHTLVTSEPHTQSKQANQ